MLKKGDKVAVVAPSGGFEAGRLQPGVAWLEQQGFVVKMMPHVFDHYRYMAGKDEARAADIHAAFADKEIKALFCAYGAAGSTKILDYIDYQIVKENPKPVIGLSDSTGLQNALYARSGNVSYTGFLPIYDFKNGLPGPLITQSLLKVLCQESLTAEGGECLRGGQAQGVMVGGCLSVFCYLCGTSYLPDLTGKILLLEDVGEYTYRLELMLNQLRQQPGFAQIAGVVFGRFAKCEPESPEDGTTEDILKDFAAQLSVPVMFNFPYGHIPERYVLPIGAAVEMDADKGTLKILSAING